MKRILNKYIATLILGLFIVSVNNVAGQDEKPDLLLDLVYRLPVNQVPELVVQARIKVERKFQNMEHVRVHVYMDEVSEANLLGTVITSAKGFGKVHIPAHLRELWNGSDTHAFIAEVEADPRFVETRSEIEVAKGRLVMEDRSDDEEKTVMVRFEELKNGAWLPVPDQEVKILVKRSMGNILIGEDETYTTDENGEIEAVFSRDGLWGDDQGNLIILAKTEDNELYGNLITEATLTWGKPLVVQSNFDKRTLWATRDKAPMWLLVLASSIVAIVWSVIIYLFWQLFRIKKLGKGPSGEERKENLIQDASIPA